MSEIIAGNIAAVKVREIYQDKLEARNADDSINVVFSHLGTFTLDFVSGLTDWMEKMMISVGDKRIVIKRMYTILIEGLKNVRKHGERDPKGEQLGFLMICKRENDYQIAIANLVKRDSKEDLIGFIENINSYSEEDLPVKLFRALDSEFLNSESGAGLGMIITRIKTKGKLHYTSYEINENLDLFVFEVSLSRTIE